MTNPQATPLADGEGITFQATRTVTVTTLCVTVDAAYTVTTMSGPDRIGPWCATYPREHLALEAAAHAVRVFVDFGTADQIEAYRNVLAISLRGQHDRRRRGMHSPARIARLDAQLDAVADLRTLTFLAAA